MKLLLFDIDGTLLLSGGAGKIAFERTFDELFGVCGVWKNIIPDGKTDPLIIEEIIAQSLDFSLSEAQYVQVCQMYCRLFDDEVKRSQGFKLMPGVGELLNGIYDPSRRIFGIATGNFEATAKMKLKHAGLDHFFQVGGYASDSRSRFELTLKAIQRAQDAHGRVFLPHDIYIIGDSIYDIRVAKKIGATSIAVATGSTPRTVLKAENPTYLFENLPPPQIMLELISGAE